MDFYEKRDSIEPFENKKIEYLSKSEIQRYYAGKKVFITGGLGFIGSVLVEKLLRSCPDIGKVYLLLRPKRGRSVQERLDRFLNYEIFTRLKISGICYKSKVEAIEGNCEERNCGMKNEDVDMIKNEINIIFHIAACLNMDSPLRKAYDMNVQSVIDLMDIAVKMKKLKAFVQVSTAYAHASQKHVGEVYYPPGYNHYEIKEILDRLDEEGIASITPKLVGPWHNTYGFTKAIAEDTVKQYSDKIPIAVARPSIVIGCANEPLRGWINNVYGVTGVSTAASSGFIHVWYADELKIADIIPADYVANALVAIAWDLNCNKRPKENSSVYNIVSAPKAPTTWKEYMYLTEMNAVRDKIVPSTITGEYNFRLQKHINRFYIQVVLMHVLPGILIDTGLLIMGKKPRLCDGFIKIQNFNLKIGPYSVNEWHYSQDNFDRMWSLMSDQDRDIFYINMNGFDWKEYHLITIRSIRLYLLKDSFDTLEKSRKNYMRLVMARNCFLAGLSYLLLKWISIL